MEQIPLDRLLVINLAMGTVIFYWAATIYVMPKLKEMSATTIFVPVLFLHSPRHLGLMFMASGVAREGMPTEFAYTHKHPRVKRWLAARPRYHLHFTPTYSSWLNQVEIWFNIITQRAIRRGSFRSVPDLVAKIRTFTDTYDPLARPFAWTATADSILQKMQRLCQSISGTRH